MGDKTAGAALTRHPGLTWINYELSRLRHMPGGGTMLRTYTLFLRNSSTPDRFVPFLARSDVEALRHARTLLNDHPECEIVEVHFGKERLFTVERPPA